MEGESTNEQSGRFWSEGERELVEQIRRRIQEIKDGFERIDAEFASRSGGSNGPVEFDYSAEEYQNDMADYIYLGELSEELRKMQAEVSAERLSSAPFSQIKAKRKAEMLRKFLDSVVEQVGKDRVW